MRISVYAVIAITAVAPAGLFAQAAGAPAFEVASVKPASPEDRVIGLFTLKAAVSRGRRPADQCFR
jgi:hypothetical protein